MSAATAVRFAAEHRDHGTALPKPQGRPAGQFGKLAPHREFLLEIVQADLGITPEPRDDHACYIKNWLRVLKNDKKAIFSAAAKASQASTWLLAHEDGAA